MTVEKYRGRGLSKYRTYNVAEKYIEAKSAEDVREGLEYARANSLPLFILGAGSNVFFQNYRIKTLILKNALPKTVINIRGDLFEVSSSEAMLSLLKRMYLEGRDAPYYLASAPCEIGGAIAMNAGSGLKEGLSISDFIESVKYVDADGKVREKNKGELNFSYRKSDFLSGEFKFIISAKFIFPKREFSENPIEARMDWARKNQDLSAPNCGSLCGRYDANIMKIVRFATSFLPAGLSPKKLNWAYNRAENPFYLRVVFKLIKFLHKLFGRELKFEVRIVE